MGLCVTYHSLNDKKLKYFIESPRRIKRTITYSDNLTLLTEKNQAPSPEPPKACLETRNAEGIESIRLKIIAF